MKSIALWTVLAMTASTMAFASPTGRVADRDEPHLSGRAGIEVTINRDHYDRYGDSHWSRDFKGRWAPLTPSTSARGWSQFLPTASRHYRKLRIEGLRGQATITKVAIQFDNGTTQIVDMNTPLPGGTGEVLDLTGGVRTVHRVIVYSDPQTRGTYAVYGA